jgi:hypothetical protein
MEFYSSTRKNEAVWFDSKWMQLEDNMLSKAGSERQRSHVFSHMWKTDPKDKTYTQNQTRSYKTYMQNMFVIVELFYGTWGWRERKGE